MKIINSLFLTAVMGMILISCASVRDNVLRNLREKEDEQHHRILSTRPLPENISAILDIPYTDSGHRGHLLDVYYPSNIEGPFPVIINIHGGGFIYENKENNKLYCYNIAKDGFIVFNINYRLVTEGNKFPGQIPDVITALDWIGNNMNQYPANAEKVYVIGHSAGGYLAVITSLITESQRLQNVFNVSKPNIKINALALNCGFLQMERRGFKWWFMKWAIFDKGFKKKEYYPNLIFKDLPEINLLPPVFITSNSDDSVNVMTFYFVNVLKENNLEHYFYYIEREDRRLRHCFDVFNPAREESIKLRDEMLRYFLLF